MRASPAYPQTAQRSYVKWIFFAVCALFGLYVLSPGADETGPPKVAGNIRGPPSVKLSELLAVGLELTEQAAEEIKEVKHQNLEEVRVKGQTKEGVDEPVTNADARSNKVFINGFRNHFPGIKMLSEETEPEKAYIQSASTALGVSLENDPILDLDDVLVIVDPLDATKEFTEDLRQYVTTMVCVVHNGKPIAGIINQVFEDQKPVWGVVGAGGGKGMVFGPTGAKEPDEGSVHKVTLSRSHTGEGGSVVEKYFPDREVILAGGAGYKALLVIGGEAEAYIHVTHIKSWDVCAAEAVTKANGGEFTDVSGSALDYRVAPKFTNGIVATRSREVQDYYIKGLQGRLT